jgi:choline-sulfatase
MVSRQTLRKAMPTDPRPNILILMTDQQRGDALSIEGHPCLMTPNMDNIAGSGVRFSKAYTTCPSCVPARRSFMSGQFPRSTGMVGYEDGVEWEKHPPLMPQVLRDAGYQTALIGRSMHLHPPRKRYGFEQAVQHGWESDYLTWLQPQAPDSAGGYNGTGVMHNDWTARPWHLDEALHQTNWTVSEAIKWLDRRDPTAPFFLIVSFIAPHPPLVPPAFYMDRYLRQNMPDPVIGDWATRPADGGLGDDVSSANVDLRGEALRSARAGYYGLINHVDDQIRRLLNPVDGIDRRTGGNTVVMFTSDHGEMLGDHHLWRKTVPFEPSARVPMLCRAPQRFELKRRSVIDAPVCLEDVMPTALDFAGVEIPSTVEGRSLLPLMRGESPTWREHLHIEHAPMHQTLTDGREKFIWMTQDGRELFFDLANDPNETRNLATAPAKADRVSYWRSRLVEALQDRPEGFVADGKLTPGRPYRAQLPHARISPFAG